MIRLRRRKRESIEVVDLVDVAPFVALPFAFACSRRLVELARYARSDNARKEELN